MKSFLAPLLLVLLTAGSANAAANGDPVKEFKDYLNHYNSMNEEARIGFDRWYEVSALQYRGADLLPLIDALQGMNARIVYEVVHTHLKWFSDVPVREVIDRTRVLQNAKVRGYPGSRWFEVDDMTYKLQSPGLSTEQRIEFAKQNYGTTEVYFMIPSDREVLFESKLESDPTNQSLEKLQKLVRIDAKVKSYRLSGHMYAATYPKSVMRKQIEIRNQKAANKRQKRTIESKARIPSRR